MSRRLSDPWIDSFLQCFSSVAAPPAYLLWTAIATVSGALQRKVWVEFPKYGVVWFPSLYVLLIGPPGTRKGTAIGKGERLIRQVKEVNVLANNITAEAIVRRMGEKTQKFIFEGHKRTHHSAMVIAEELPTLIKPGETGVIVDLAKLWNCDEVYHKDTKTQGSDKVDNPYLTLVAGVTPAMLRLSVPVEVVGSGLTSRMVIIYEKDLVDSPSLTQDPEQYDSGLEEALLHDLRRINKLYGRFVWPVEAAEWYDRWWAEYGHTMDRLNADPSIPESVREHFSRKPTMLWRVAMCFSASREDSLEITVEDLEVAHLCLTKAEEGFKEVFAGMGAADPKRNKLVGRVRDIIRKKPGVDEGWLRGCLLGEATGEEIREIVNGMVAAGEISAEGAANKRKLREVGA